VCTAFTAIAIRRKRDGIIDSCRAKRKENLLKPYEEEKKKKRTACCLDSLGTKHHKVE
jgi:hypothetical protein